MQLLNVTLVSVLFEETCMISLGIMVMISSNIWFYCCTQLETKWFRGNQPVLLIKVLPRSI